MDVPLAQTVVNGGIFNNTTWTIDESPYFVTEDIVVFPDVDLTINSGVEIRFAADARLELREGNLYANGTVDAPIVFTLDSDSPQGALKWKGIENTSDSGNEIEIELSHVVIEYAQTGVHYGSGVGERSIDHAVFRYNDRGVYDGGQGYNWVTISDAEFLENGIGMEGRMSVYNSSFTNNEVGFGNPHTFSNINSGGRVVNCSFIGNDLGVGTIGQIIVIAIIENSTFQDNDKGFYGYWANIDNSVFTGSSEVAVSAQKGEIQHSVFSENQIGMEVFIFNNALSIHDNSFSSNDIGIKVDGAGAAIYENAICENTLFGVKLTTDDPVDLNNNCWCTIDPIDIALLVEDAYDNPSLGIATYDVINADCILANLVYPGDANNDGFVNAWDLLQIGLAFDFTGSPRANPSSNWLGQESEEWAVTFSNNVNAKHADCNGDGNVGVDDTYVIDSNYSNTHVGNTTYEMDTGVASNSSLSMELSGSLSPGNILQLDISIADSNNPISDMFGIAFTLEGSEGLLSANSIELNSNNSLLGTNDRMITKVKAFPNQSLVDVAMVRNDHQGASGSGHLASLSFQVPADFDASSVFLSLANLTVLTSDGAQISMEHNVASLETSRVENVFTSFNVYPNPVKEHLTISAFDSEVKSVDVINSKGKTVMSIVGKTEQLDISQLIDGVYFVRIIATEGIGVEKIIKK